MNKKEIIRNLKYTMEKHKNDRVDTFGTNISLMCKDILDYLEQEPCGKDINVPATDCISRQMAIDSLGECPMNWTDSEGEVTAERDWKDTVEMLKSLPSVTPQPKTEVLDKIRAEVKALPNANPSYSGYIDVVDREDVLEIIDKYKTESEVEK